jgi:hypothetical protein
VKSTSSGARSPIKSHFPFLKSCRKSPLCSGTFRWTAVQMHNEIVIKHDDKIPNVPLVVGSGCHLIVSFAALFPKISNILLSRRWPLLEFASTWVLGINYDEIKQMMRLNKKMKDGEGSSTRTPNEAVSKKALHLHASLTPHFMIGSAPGYH